MQTKMSLEKGDLLYEVGEEATHAYLVLSGELEMSRPQGNTVKILRKALPGEIIGEMSLINNSTRNTRVTAVKPSVIAKMDKQKMLERINNADPIVQSLLTDYARRLLSTINSTETSGNIDSIQKNDNLNKISLDKIKLENELIQAIEDKKLQVLLQPILEVATNKIVGYEALIRWNHPVHGPISPLVLISLAEETSLIDDIGEYVIDFACISINKLLPLDKNSKPFISINLSTSQLANKAFIQGIINKVKSANLPKGSLKLEIAGSSILFEDEIGSMLELCREHGLKVALDNFGTGESNLSLTRNLKFDTINIDRSFTMDIQGNPRSLALVNTIVHMASTLNSDVMIAGIESEEMLDYARKLNCHYAQGYHIGKPQDLTYIMDQVSKGKNT